MILKEKINNCTYLRIVNNSIFCDIDNVCYMDWKPTKIPDDTIIFCNQNKNYFYLENELYEISSEVISKKIIDYSPSSYIEPIEDYYLIFNRISRKEKYYQLINKNKETIWLDKINWGYKILNNSLFLFENDNKLSLINLLTKSPIWSYSLPEGFKIFGAPEIIDNVVYILAYTSHFQESHRIGLDIETGNKIWEISGGVDKNTTPIHAKTFNPKDKLLYGLYKTFQVFNPKTGELLVNKIIEKANEDHFDAYSKAIYDDKLWFVSGKYENCKFGYINLKTNEIEFLQDFPQENDEIFDTPIFHQKKLYLRGKYYNNLYIFEE